MGFSFVTFGMAVVSFKQIVDANSNSVAQLGALVMVGFGMVILLPKFSSGFAQLITGAAGHADNRLDQIDRHAIAGQIIGGLLLGVVWSPCIGPILGGAIASASQGKDLIWASLIMAIFALRVATVILTIGLCPKFDTEPPRPDADIIPTGAAHTGLCVCACWDHPLF